MRNFLAVLFLFALVLSCDGLHAQGIDTASQPLHLSAFVAGTNVATHVGDRRNTSLTVGADLTFYTTYGLRPSVELRGTTPVSSGTVDSQHSYLIGPKLEHQFGSLHPYVDAMIGRGRIDYSGNGFIYGDWRYVQAPSLIYAGGGGLDVDVTHALAVKTDLQVERWKAPTVATGVIHPVAATVGVIFRFDFNPHHLGL